MKKLKSAVLGVVCVGVLAFGISLLTSTPAPAVPAPPPTPAIPVTVVNTPLPVQGTVTANIGNAAVPVTGTVAVSTLPPISLGNTETTPMFVRDVDNPARRPVLGSCDMVNAPGGGFQSCNIGFYSPSGNFTTVPTGSRLVIEYVSGELDLPTGAIPDEFNVRTSLGNAYTGISFDPRFVGSIAATDLWKVSQQTRMYEDPGSTVVLEVSTTAPASSTFFAGVTVTGYLVNQ